MFSALSFDAGVTSFSAMAGSDYAWHGAYCNDARPSGGRRNGGAPRQGMREWLTAAQGGVCPHCDVTLHNGEQVDIAHVVGAGAGRRGYLPGNVYASHNACNVRACTANGMTDGYTLTLHASDFVHPEVIPTVWPVLTVSGFNIFDSRYVAGSDRMARLATV